MKNLIIYFSVFTVVFASSCSQDNYPYNDYGPVELYDEFWHHVNDNYIYFPQKNVDWDSVHVVNSSLIDDNSTEEELFSAMEQSLLSLKDGHNFLNAPDRMARSYNFTEGYEVHFDLDLVKNSYLQDYTVERDYFTYGLVDDKTLYVHVSKMQRIRYLRHLLREQAIGKVDNLIIDLRGNTGGDSNDIPDMLGDYVSERINIGAYLEKSGPGHNEVTDPIHIYAEPSDVHFDGNIMILINRRCYSATSYMASMCKELDNFQLIGQITGGGGGGNAGFQLSNGWVVSVSVSDFIDTSGRSIELGVKPDFIIENTAQDIANGKDRMLEQALEMR